MLDRVLRSDCATDSGQHGREHYRMALPMAEHVMQQKPARPIRRELRQGDRCASSNAGPSPTRMAAYHSTSVSAICSMDFRATDTRHACWKFSDCLSQRLIACDQPAIDVEVVLGHPARGAAFFEHPPDARAVEP